MIPFPNRRAGLLSRVERETLLLAAQGYATKQIARMTYRADSTVKNNLSSCYAKLGVGDRVEAMLIAHHLGIIDLGAIAAQTYVRIHGEAQAAA